MRGRIISGTIRNATEQNHSGNYVLDVYIFIGVIGLRVLPLSINGNGNGIKYGTEQNAVVMVSTALCSIQGFIQNDRPSILIR